MKSIAIVLGILLLVLQYKLWFEVGGVQEALNLQGAISEQVQENDALIDRNAALAAEVKDLKNGRDAIAERARTELGMIRPDETFFQVVE